MKGLLIFVFAAIGYVNSQYTCGCSSLPPTPCRPIPPCARPPIPAYPILAPPVLQSPPTCGALPSCNCPALPSLPVSPQILPGFGASLLGIPFLNAGLGLGSPCLGGFTDLSVASPLGLINPFLPAASPVSAIAPTVSSLYPPINPCNCGCKYLRKIPCPPPCI